MKMKLRGAACQPGHHLVQVLAAGDSLQRRGGEPSERQHWKVAVPRGHYLPQLGVPVRSCPDLGAQRTAKGASGKGPSKNVKNCHDVSRQISTICARELEFQAPATGLRKPKSPKVPGRVLGRVPGKSGDCWEQCRFTAFPKKETGLPALLPAVPRANPFFPALSPALLGIWAFSVL